jgi:hypothetical protein
MAASLAIQVARAEVLAAALPTPAPAAGVACAHPAADTLVAAALEQLPGGTHAYELQTDGTQRNPIVDNFICALITLLANSNVKNKTVIAHAVNAMSPIARRLLAAAFWEHYMPKTTAFKSAMATKLKEADPAHYNWEHKLDVLTKLWNTESDRAALKTILTTSRFNDPY